MFTPTMSSRGRVGQARCRVAPPRIPLPAKARPSFADMRPSMESFQKASEDIGNHPSPRRKTLQKKLNRLRPFQLYQHVCKVKLGLALPSPCSSLPLDTSFLRGCLARGCLQAPLVTSIEADSAYHFHGFPDADAVKHPHFCRTPEIWRLWS